MEEQTTTEKQSKQSLEEQTVVEEQVELSPLEKEEEKLQRFILQTLAMLDSFQDPVQKAAEIVKAFKFYFTKVYRDYQDAEEAREP